MIQAIKSRLWDLLARREVSLAMVYARDGRILWSCGRSITGDTIATGTGFPHSPIRQTLTQDEGLEADDVVSLSEGSVLPDSAQALFIRSLLVQPIGQDLFLYVDSGSKSRFDPSDREVIRALGQLLSESLADIAAADRGPASLAGTSDQIARVRSLIARYAVEEEPVLLLGETGVGKTFVAGLIHQHSGRRGGFVSVHVPSIPESLFERELFGHARGAYTGAEGASGGLLGEAEGGTLLLDEVSELPPATQAKLLEVVETRSFRRVGDPRARTADVRILAASNRDLSAGPEAAGLRPDLYYRLSALPVVLPPLRERPEDIKPLVEQHRDLMRGTRPTPGFWRVLADHAWPGNVRELLQVLRRIGIQAEAPEIGEEVRPLLDERVAAGAGAADDAVERVEQALEEGASFWDTAWRAFLDRELNRRQLQALLRARHRREGGSLKQLAAALNLEPDDYPRFVSALHKYDVHPAPRRE